MRKRVYPILVTVSLLSAAFSQPVVSHAAPLRVIATVRTRALCDQTRELALPVGYIAKTNDKAFQAIDSSMLHFMEQNDQLAGHTSDAVKKIMSVNGTGNVDLAPSSALDAAQIQNLATVITQNILVADQFLDKSWKVFPKGKNPTVDALRQRVQNLVDLQRALANQYLQFAGALNAQSGLAAIGRNANISTAVLENVIEGDVAAFNTERADDNDPESVAQADVHETADFETPYKITRELRLQEAAFAYEMIHAVDTCR